MLSHPLPGPRRTWQRRRGNAGMTLVEVLVALVVVSVGMLGVAALQVSSLRNSHGSYLRTQATQLADDIIDRMRANRKVALAGGYDIAVGQTITVSGTSTRADLDRAEWKDALKAALPKLANGADPDGAISLAGTIVTVRIQWGERDPDNPNMEFVTRTEI